MDQLKQLLARLSLAQRVTIGVAVVGVVVGLMLFSRWNKERDFRPLFSHLNAEDAGQVLAKLKESNVEYRLGDNGGTVLVNSQKVAELRLQMATSGLPKTGRIGYELFDKTNFGATDFAEQVNFHRAIEGELERSVMSLSEVEQARVHITFPKDSIYTESRLPAKASVLVKLKPGAQLSVPNVTAIAHLTASAVEGLVPDAVSVLDMSGTLLNPPRKTPGEGEVNDATLEYRLKVERDLLAKVNRTLEPLLGTDHYRAAVSVECDISSGEQSEEVFDPSKSVMTASVRTEDGGTGATTAGVPGTPSNLPRPTSTPRAGTNAVNRRSENLSFQTSRFVRHTRTPQGNIKRISASVLLDHELKFEKGRQVAAAPTPEKVKAVHDLVAGAIGTVNDRDQVVVESLLFDATAKLVQPPPPSAPASGAKPGDSKQPEGGGGLKPFGPPWLQNLMKQNNFPMIAGAVGGVLVLFIAGGVFVLLRKKRKKKASAAAAEVEGGKALGAGTEKAVAAPDVEKELTANIAEQAALKEQQAKEVLASLKLPPVTTKKTEVLVKHIAAEAKKDPSSMAQVMRTWMTNEN